MTELDEQRRRARAAREALVGRTIAGRYVLRALVGHGGMGAVYEAEHLGLGKRVAVKLVDPEFATDEQVVARFAREARATSAIESPHIVTVFDAGSDAGAPFLVMELLRGEDLGERLRRLGRVAEGDAMHVAAQVLKGLARAHAVGIVHRDLKPDNVFLVKHDGDPLFAKIVDFGISKIDRPRATTSVFALTGRGTVLGTPFYMSPEQAQASSEVDARADLYSVGAILFECLTGRPPHTGESYEQVILAICMTDAPSLSAIDPTISEATSAFVARALARDPARRFASATSMLEALHAIAPAERARVPLPAPSSTRAVGEIAAATILAGGAAEPETVAAPTAAAPTAATRLGVGSLDATPFGDTELSLRPPSHLSDRPPASLDGAPGPRLPPLGGVWSEVVDTARSPEGVAPTVLSPGVLPRGARGQAPLAPATEVVSAVEVAGAARRRGRGMFMLAAVGATLLGVGVTFALITAFGREEPRGGHATLASAAETVDRAGLDAALPDMNEVSPADALAPAATPSASGAPAPPPEASGVLPLDAQEDAAPRETGKKRVPRGTSASPSSGGSGKLPGSRHPPSGASSKPLDISRELP